VPVAFPGPVADAAPGMLSLQVAECVAAASVSADDVAAVECPSVDLALASGADQPIGLVIGNGSAASGARSALRPDDGTVPHARLHGQALIPPTPNRLLLLLLECSDLLLELVHLAGKLVHLMFELAEPFVPTRAG
jgi:hypothetical protein